MAPNPKVVAAYRAMANLGIAESKVKPVLKKLLKLYDKNWALIEEENYRALADAIFEDDEFKEEEMEAEEAQIHVEPARPLKRLRLRGQESQPVHPVINNTPCSAASPLKKPKLENGTLTEGFSGQQPQNKAMSSDGNVRLEARPGPMRDALVDKGKQPALPQVALRGGKHISEAPTVEPGKFLLPNNQMTHGYALIIPKDEPIEELPEYEVPIAMSPPEPSRLRDSSMKNGVTGKQSGHVTVASSQCRDEVKDDDIFPSSNEETTSNVVIASSASGEVKLSLSCSSVLRGPDLRMPCREKLLRMMEDKCLRSYKISDPKFSVSKLLRDICDCMLESSTDSNDYAQEGSMTR